MPFEDQAEIVSFYEQALAAYGDGPRAVGWNSRHTQAASFLQLTRVDGLRSGVRVLDVGCGLGDFAEFLARRGLDVDFVGYDITPAYVDEARRRFPGARFEVRDILADPPAERFDFVFCSGALGLRLPDHDAWMRRMLRAMFDVCDGALAFNVGSARFAAANPEFVDRDVYYYMEPGDALTAALELSSQVAVDHTAVADVFAVYVYRANTAPVAALIDYLEPTGELGDAHRAVVEHFTTLGLHREALAWVETLPESLDRCEVIASLALSLGDRARVMAALERGVQLEPSSVRAHLGLAHALMGADRYADAVPVLERAGELDPEDPAIPRWLASCRDRS